MAALLITDNRTNRKYRVPIQHNAIKATDFAQINTRGTSVGAKNDVDIGLRVLDPGFRNTAVKQSSITKLDGDAGTIRFRGHDINDLFNHHDFESVAFLLIWGCLPDLAQRNEFKSSLTSLMSPPREVRRVVETFARTAPDFTIIIAAMSVWNAVEADHIPIAKGSNLYNPKNIGVIDKGIIRTLAATATCTALACCHKRGISFTEPDSTLSFPGNILLMFGLVDLATGKPSEEHTSFMGKVMMLYADHEMTNSTASFLHVGSTLADPLSCTIAAIAAGSGPLHGGAFEMAFKQFSAIGRVENVPSFLASVRNKETRIFGFGHRIWRALDPRYTLVRQLMNSDALKPAIDADPLLAVAMEIEKQANADDYFRKRRIRANADLLGCFMFNALGFSAEEVLSVVTIARMTGIVAHWREQMQQPVGIWRPQAIFVDPEDEDTTPVQETEKTTRSAPRMDSKARL